MDRRFRFQTFVKMLEDAPDVANYADARTLLEATLNAVEDLHSGVPFNPTNYISDGRMYPPEDDAERVSPFAEARRFRTRAHYVDVGSNGAIRISRVHTGGIELDKAGADGRTIDRISK